LERARELNVPFTTLLIKDFATPSDWHNALEQQLRKLQPDFIVLAGYLRKIPSNILAQFPERIINIHPSLLPQYGGQGMYGHHVFEAVLAAGEKRTGVTVHLIDGEFDRGRILAQRELAIQSNETVQSLQKKIQQVEHQLYVEVLRELCAVTGES
jgi:phosphoribosylglycinamide formyltransferase-1